MTELEAYKIFIEEKAKNNATDILPNAGKDHAAIVMTEMFKKTTKSVKMVVGSFDGSISNDNAYLNEFEKAVDRGVDIEIIFLGIPNKESRTYQMLCRKKQQNPFARIRFWIASVRLTERMVLNATPYHFAVFDTDKYRFEKDTVEYLAWACFNDPERGELLSNIFDTAKKQSEVIA